MKIEVLRSSLLNHSITKKKHERKVEIYINISKIYNVHLICFAHISSHTSMYIDSVHQKIHSTLKRRYKMY